MVRVPASGAFAPSSCEALPVDGQLWGTPGAPLVLTRLQPVIYTNANAGLHGWPSPWGIIALVRLLINHDIRFASRVAARAPGKLRAPALAIEVEVGRAAWRAPVYTRYNLAYLLTVTQRQQC